MRVALNRTTRFGHATLTRRSFAAPASPASGRGDVCDGALLHESAVLRLRPKRKRLLRQEAVRHVVADHAVVRRQRFVLRHLDRRAEQVVEEREVRGVVAVDRLVSLRVVPVVEVRRDDQVAQRPQPHAARWRG